MNKLHLIKQHDEKDCGAACLSMILDFYGKKMTIAAVREAICVDQYGANIYGMLEGARKYGLNAQAYSGDSEQVWAALQDDSTTFPAVIRILNRGIYEHYVVINGIHSGKLSVFDPDMGKRAMSREEFQDCFLGQILVFSKGEQFCADNHRKGRFRRYMDMLFRQKSLLFTIGVLSLSVTAIGLAGAFIFQFLIDHVLNNLSDVEALDEALDRFAVLITGLGLLYLVKLAVQMLRGKLLTTMSRNIDLPLMLGYYDHVAQLPMRFFDTRKTGEIMSRFSDAGRIRDAISGAALTLMIDTIMVIVCSVILYRTSSVLFAVAMAAFFLYLLVTILYVRPLDQFNRESMEQNAQFSSYLKESIDGMETVKTAQAVEDVKEKTSILFTSFVNTSVRGALLSLSKDAIIECITSLSTLVLLWIGAVSIIHGEMTVGGLVTFVSLLSYFLDPIQNLVDLQSNLQTAFVAADRLNDVLDLEQEHSGDVEPENDLDQIQFDDVSFRYGTRSLVLDGLSFTAQAGQQIALVGESGCGKSTISKLIQGLYYPESGNVKINGYNIRDLSLKWLRSQIACVPQSTFLFSDTLRNNLTLGLDKDQIPSDEELTNLLDACSCQFVGELPLGLDSILEENGANLSGGQRQRLAIVRALLKKPKLLILDEATSALDTITEHNLQEAVRQLCPNTIVLMIAHRLSTVLQSDEIIVVDHGKAAEQGTHSQLLQKQQRYADLWHRQNGTAA